MFPWIFNYVTTDSVGNMLCKQNDILEQIACSLKTIANNNTDQYSFWSTVILGIITLCVTIYLGKQQNHISRRQHNLELFNKRWLAFEELKTLGAEAEGFKHIFVEDVKNEETESFYEVSHKLKFLASKCEILFNRDIKEGILKATIAFEKYHQNRDLIEQWKRYFNEFVSNGRLPVEYQKAIDNDVKLCGEVLVCFDGIYEKMLSFIKDIEV